jgi:toxin ParE1/3/4
VPPEIVIRATVRREIKAHGLYLEQHGGPDVTDGFLAAVQQSFERLARAPKAGVLCEFRKAALRRVRRWPVKGFENWLIFYIPKRNGVEIVHIIHGARDIQGLLDA